MRYLLLFWALPLVLFWGWFGLSYYDINFGLLIFSRLVHDFAFQFYGDMLGIDPALIPPLVAKACVTDSLLIFGFFAFRRRREAAQWLRANWPRYFGDRPVPSILNRSSAP